MPAKRKMPRIRHGRRAPARDGGRAQWLFGIHAVRAALANPARTIHRVVASPHAAESLESAPVAVETLEARDIAALLPPGAVHQGLACLAGALAEPDFAALADRLEAAPAALVVVLDRVSDPQNVGAVLRSAAAFGADGVIAPDRHAPEPTATLAKAASGALETVPYLRVANLARAIDRLKRAELWCFGLDPGAGETFGQAELPAKCAFVLGAEGPGVRRLTAEHCDAMLRIPIGGAVESLNVSNSAAIALYAYRTARDAARA